MDMSKNSELMQFYEIYICQIMIFRPNTVYNKHCDTKNWRSNQRKIASIIASAQIILLPTVDRLFIYFPLFSSPLGFRGRIISAL